MSGKESKKEESYKIVQSVDDLVGSFNENAAPIVKKTVAELKKDLAETRAPVSKTVLLCRRIRLNTDLAVVALIVAFSTAFGFSLRGFHWTSIFDYAEILITMGLVFVSIVVHIITPKGMLSTKVMTRVNKGKEELDDQGRSISIKR